MHLRKPSHWPMKLNPADWWLFYLHNQVATSKPLSHLSLIWPETLVSPYRANIFNGRQFSPLHLDGPSLYDPTFPVSSCRLRIFDNSSALCRSSPSSTRRGGVQIWCHGCSCRRERFKSYFRPLSSSRLEIREQVARDLCTSATTRLPHEVETIPTSRHTLCTSLV